MSPTFQIQQFDITAKWLRRLLLITLALITLNFGLQWLNISPTLSGFPVNEDPMYYSGFLTILPALWLSMTVESRFVALAKQIDEDRLVFDGSDGFQELSTAMVVKTRNWALFGSVLVGTVVAYGYYLFYVHTWILAIAECARANGNNWQFCWSRFREVGGLEVLQTVGIFSAVSVYLGFMVGHRLGTMAGLASVAVLLSEQRNNFRLILNHPDGFGGFGQFGKFVALLGIVASIPVTWLGVWLVLINQDSADFAKYQQWTIPFTLQFLASLLFLSLCFIKPFIHLTWRYRVERNRLIDHWSKVATDESELVPEGGPNNNHMSDSQLSRKAAKQLPEYPVGSGLNNLFSISSAAPFFTFALEVAISGESSVVSLIVNLVTG